MKILHLLSGGGIGGIEVLCRDIADLSKERHEFCFLYSGGEIADEMYKKNHPVYFFYEKSMTDRIISLMKLVNREKYDAIIVHHEGMGIYSFYLILTYIFKKVKFIKYLHCSFEPEYFYKGKKATDLLNYNILKKVLKRSDHLIAVSEFVKKSYCEEFHCNSDKVSVIYNGIRFLPGEDSDRKESNEIRLLYVGRLTEVKGVRLLLYAVKNLISKGEKISLTILGDGPQYEEYVQLAEQLQIKEKVDFEGYQLNKRVYYQNADVFVYPSVWQEAFGISIVEALAQGMICVVSNAGGIPEIIEDGVDGFLFERGSIESLTETLVNVVKTSNGTQYVRMKTVAKQKARQFDISKMIADLEKICR